MNKFLENIYNYSPAFIQNIGVSLYGMKLYFREYGKDFNDKLDEFEKNGMVLKRTTGRVSKSKITNLSKALLRLGTILSTDNGRARSQTKRYSDNN